MNYMTIKNLAIASVIVAVTVAAPRYIMSPYTYECHSPNPSGDKVVSIICCDRVFYTKMVIWSDSVRPKFCYPYYKYYYRMVEPTILYPVNKNEQWRGGLIRNTKCY